MTFNMNGLKMKMPSCQQQQQVRAIVAIIHGGPESGDAMECVYSYTSSDPEMQRTADRGWALHYGFLNKF